MAVMNTLSITNLFVVEQGGPVGIFTSTIVCVLAWPDGGVMVQAQTEFHPAAPAPLGLRGRDDLSDAISNGEATRAFTAASLV